MQRCHLPGLLQLQLVYPDSATVRSSCCLHCFDWHFEQAACAFRQAHGTELRQRTAAAKVQLGESAMERVERQRDVQVPLPFEQPSSLALIHGLAMRGDALPACMPTAVARHHVYDTCAVGCQACSPQQLFCVE